MTTLKQNYKSKKLNELKTRVKNAESTLLETNLEYQVELLLEALDQNEYKEATEVITKLQKINDLAKKAELDLLSGAINTIVKEINSFTGGTTLDRFKGSMSNLFSKAPAKNPILAGLAMVAALEAGFKLLPTILKNNIPEIDSDKEKQGMKLIDIIKDDDKLKKNIQTNLLKAFVPAGTFGKIFGKIPGVDTDKLTADLMNATVSQLNDIAKILNEGPKTSDIDPALANPKEAGSKEKNAKENSEDAGKAQKGKAKNILVRATQATAKSAGISDGKAVVALMKKMGYEVGSYEASLVIPTLRELMADKNIDDEQTDGFVRGLMTDFEKEFKNDVDKKIKDKLEKMKQTAGEKKTSPAKLVAAAASNLN
jgi:hypothetical protein